MFFRYGSATFPNNTVRIDGMTSRMIMEGLMPVGVTKSWSIYGKIYASSLADLNVKILQTEAAFGVQGAGAFLLDNNGGLTAHTLGAAGSRCGCKVIMSPTFEPLTGIEMSMIRSFRVELQADYDIPIPGLVVRFNETITIQGDGGPEEDYLECVIGDPIHQVTKEKTKVIVTQTGTIVGRYRRVYPDQWVQPALPGFRIGPLCSLSPGTAEVRDGPPGNPIERNFPVNYTWVFKAPKFITPNINNWRN